LHLSSGRRIVILFSPGKITMTLTIYGSFKSRTMRVLWAAAELGLIYEHIPLSADDQALKSPDFLRLNPAGRIPTIVDDGFALSESLAINLYLAKKYSSSASKAFCPASPEGEASVWRWTLWAQAHLEPWAQQDQGLEDLRVAMRDHAPVLIQAALTVLNDALANRIWLVGEDFTVGDLNVAAVLSPSRTARIDLSAHHRVRDWLTRCYTRPAAVATRQRFEANLALA
jgi:glutathione S-transferase